LKRVIHPRGFSFVVLCLGVVLLLFSYNTDRGSTAGQDEAPAQAPTPSPTPWKGPSPWESQGYDPNSLICNIPSGKEQLVRSCHLAILQDYQAPWSLDRLGPMPCIGGLAASTYPCNNVDLLSFLPLSEIGGGNGNDLWGWTDPMTGKEYAIMGRSNGTAFIDISDLNNPVYLGDLPTNSFNSAWRDIKTYDGANFAYAFIVADNSGSHGLQIFDLTQLRSVASPPVTFSESAHYDLFGSAHNIVINEDSGFAYAVGVSSGLERCSGGLHMINIQEPVNPSFAGCYSADGYTHDAQCVDYVGPDADHQGKEICFNANVDTLTIVDVDDKSSPILISRSGYSSAGYTHQGWLTADQRYYLLDDEGDEGPANTQTYIWDLADLDNPPAPAVYTATTKAIDHNLYLHNGLIFQSNYRAGLRVLDPSDISNGNLSEIGFFDIYPDDDDAHFNGAWSNYPFFDSGVVIVSGIEQGLFILLPTSITGTLQGEIIDSNSGRGIAGAEVTVTSGANKQSVSTDDNGSYSLNLPPGNYDIDVEASNYIPSSINGVLVVPDETTTQNFSLNSTLTKSFYIPFISVS
jgi:choice-of-anchor B domain-containing protein